MSDSMRLAQVIVRQIIEAGITDVVLSPGSRNAPLSLAFYAAATKKLIKLHMRLDERGAAFFALGLTKSTHRAVPIVCTSGTAVANYHPAVLEAHHTNAPLLILTADRPAMLRRTGANQTTEQARIFGKSVRYFADIDGPVFPMDLPLDSLRTGPVHLNLQFDEPLLQNSGDEWLNEVEVCAPAFVSRKSAGKLSVRDSRGVLVIGHDRAGLSVDSVKDFALKLGWPLISEDPLTFSQAISHASLFLSSTKIRTSLIPQTTIVIGRTTLSRSLNAFIKSSVKTIVIDPRIATVDSDRAADKRFTALPEIESTGASDEWLSLWNKFSQRTAKVIATSVGWNEGPIAAEIAQTIPTGSALFISSSRPIRDMEAFATARSGITTYANRGLAGIDGNISTALGVASGESSTFAVIGDLAFLHDVSALVNKEEINCRFIVINNDGGGIFSTLSQRGVNGFETLFGTPHGLNLEKIGAAFGITSRTINSIDQLKKELTSPVKGVSIVIAKVPSREANADYLKGISSKLESL